MQSQKKYPNYHYILCEETDNVQDVVPGFLVSIPENMIEALDKWEGNSYERKNIICFNRNLERIPVQIYSKKN